MFTFAPLVRPVDQDGAPAGPVALADLVTADSVAEAAERARAANPGAVLVALLHTYPVA